VTLSTLQATYNPKNRNSQIHKL